MKSPIEIVAKAAVKVKLACMSAAVATLMFCPEVLAQVEVTFVIFLNITLGKEHRQTPSNDIS